MDGYEEPDRVTVAEAAETLGVKEQAIRKRIARGTLPHDKEPDSRVCVYVGTNLEDEVQSTSTRDDTHFEALVDDLQDQVRFLREELARKDALMLNMSETMRQLTALKDEGSPEARDSPETATGPVGREKRALHRRGEATGTRTAARILGPAVRDARRVTGVVIMLTWWGTVITSLNPI